MKKGQVVIQVDKHTGKVLAKYPSIRAAAVDIGVDMQSIRRQLTPATDRPRTSKAAKYLWFTEERWNELKSLGLLKERKA